MSSVPSQIRILTVDDHPLLREGIAALVNAESDMKLVAEASNGEEAIEQFRLHRPDVTLMDLQMPVNNHFNSFQFAAELSSLSPLRLYAGRYTVASRFRCQLCGCGYIVQGLQTDCCRPASTS